MGGDEEPCFNYCLSPEPVMCLQPRVGARYISSHRMNEVQPIHTHRVSTMCRALGLGIEDRIYKGINEQQLACIKLLMCYVPGIVLCVLQVSSHLFLMTALYEITTLRPIAQEMNFPKSHWSQYLSAGLIPTQCPLLTRRRHWSCQAC